MDIFSTLGVGDDFWTFYEYLHECSTRLNIGIYFCVECGEKACKANETRDIPFYVAKGKIVLNFRDQSHYLMRWGGQPHVLSTLIYLVAHFLKNLIFLGFLKRIFMNSYTTPLYGKIKRTSNLHSIVSTFILINYRDSHPLPASLLPTHKNLQQPKYIKPLLFSCTLSCLRIARDYKEF